MLSLCCCCIGNWVKTLNSKPKTPAHAGMGVFEYFQLAEALDAEPVWVINNGIAHEDSIPAAQIWPLVQVAP